MEVTRCWGASRGPPPLRERLLGAYWARPALGLRPLSSKPLPTVGTLPISPHPPPPATPAVTLPVAPSPEHLCHPPNPLHPGNTTFFTKSSSPYPHLSTGSFRGGGGGTLIQPCSLSHKCCGGSRPPRNDAWVLKILPSVGQTQSGSEDHICALAWDGTWDLGVTSCGQVRWRRQPLNGSPASSTSEVLPGLEGPSRNCLKILFLIYFTTPDVRTLGGHQTP